MVAFNNPDHLDPKQKGLVRSPEWSRELLQFSTVILLLHAWRKTCSSIANYGQRSPTYREVRWPDQSEPCPASGDLLRRSRAEPNRNIPPPSAAERCGWYSPSLPPPHILQANIPVNSVLPFLLVPGIWQAKPIIQTLQTNPWELRLLS